MTSGWRILRRRSDLPVAVNWKSPTSTAPTWNCGELHVEKLGRGIAWLDTGTHDSLLQSSRFIEVIEKRQGLKVACVEEIAYFMKYIDNTQLEKLAEPPDEKQLWPVPDETAAAGVPYERD